jgi:hypothetical protein
LSGTQFSTFKSAGLNDLRTKQYKNTGVKHGAIFTAATQQLTPAVVNLPILVVYISSNMLVLFYIVQFQFCKNVLYFLCKATGDCVCNKKLY